MNDRGISVLDQYGFKVLGTYRGRGAIICDTNQGLKLLKELTGSKYKIEFQNSLLKNIKQSGFEHVDTFVENLSGEIVSLDKDETAYTVKDWFDGKECDVQSNNEIMQGVKTLARLHKLMMYPGRPMEIIERYTTQDLTVEYERHNRELKKVRSYIREKRRKTDFERCYMNYFSVFFEQGQEALEGLVNSSYACIRKESLKVGKVCHGEVNHHNILMLKNEIAITNFDKCCIDIQLSDLYHFMRKILEKHNWNQELGVTMLDSYDSIYTLGSEEKEYLKLRFLYPEKFWKVANYYYNSNKAWIPGKNVEKLRLLVEQNKDRDAFLRNNF